MLTRYWFRVQVPRPPAAEPCGSAGASDALGFLLTQIESMENNSIEAAAATAAPPVPSPMPGGNNTVLTTVDHVPDKVHLFMR